MNPVTMQILTMLFMKNGKPNKVLQKYGKDLLGSVIESTYENGKPGKDTLGLVTALNGGDKKKMTAAQKKALQFLEEGGAKRNKADWIAQDIALPGLAGAAKTVGNTLALQYAAPANAMSAAAEGFKVNPVIAQNTSGGRVLDMVMRGIAAAHQGTAAAKGALATGVTNTIANIANNVANTARTEDLMERQLKNSMAQRQLNGFESKPSEGEWNYMNQQMKAYNQAAAGGN